MTPEERINELQWRLDGAAAEAAEHGRELVADMAPVDVDYPPWEEWGAEGGYEDQNEGIVPWR